MCSSALARAGDNVTGARLSRTGRRLSLQRFGKLLLAPLEQAEREGVRGRSWQDLKRLLLNPWVGTMGRTVVGLDVWWLLL